MFVRTLIAVVMAAVLTAGPTVLAGGTIKGTVKWDGNAPREKPIKTDADPYCAKLYAKAPLTSERVVINDNGTMKNIFLYIKSGLPAGKDWPVPDEKVLLDQRGCSYHPHVFGIMPGQTLEIRNNDDTSHNVNCSPKQNTGFNQGQPKKGMVLDKSFQNPEMEVPFKCDVHPWMSAWCFVMDHPFFAVTDETGAFEIPDVPAGEYVVVAWQEHPGLKSQEMTVVVSDGESAAADFTFTRPGKSGMAAGERPVLDSEIVWSKDEYAQDRPASKLADCCKKGKK